MPSQLHETIAEMLRASPELVLTLVRVVRTLPNGVTARCVGDAMSSPLVSDYRPDNVIEVLTIDGKVDRVIVCEVQLQRDLKKLFSLPVYQVLARANTWCAGRLLRERPQNERVYLDLVLAGLSAETRRAVESLMSTYEYQSEFAKRYVSQGREEGRAEGLVVLRRVVRQTLEARGLAVDVEHGQKIDQCTDFEELTRWCGYAVTAKAIGDVFR